MPSAFALFRPYSGCWDAYGARTAVKGISVPCLARAPNHTESQCLGRLHIQLAPYQANYAVLLHEIVHALGFYEHSPAFMARYIYLLGKYARCDVAKLTIAARLFGVL